MYNSEMCWKRNILSMTWLRTQLSGTFLLNLLCFNAKFFLSFHSSSFLIFYCFHLINFWVNWKQINIIDILFFFLMNKQKKKNFEMEKSKQIKVFCCECLSLQFVCLFFLVAWKFYLICGTLSYYNINDNNNEYKL